MDLVVYQNCNSLILQTLWLRLCAQGSKVFLAQCMQQKKYDPVSQISK